MPTITLDSPARAHGDMSEDTAINGRLDLLLSSMGRVEGRLDGFSTRFADQDRRITEDAKRRDDLERFVRQEFNSVHERLGTHAIVLSDYAAIKTAVENLSVQSNRQSGVSFVIRQQIGWAVAATGFLVNIILYFVG